ncbi:inner centromere protein-like [Phaethornis superciliosus]
MAEADGPTRLLEVCGLRLSRFLHDAEHKHLAWLREVEEQGMRMVDSNFGAEPELMPKTPSQRRRPKKRQSCSLKDEHKELNRRRLSRRRSSSKLVSSKASSQKHHSKGQTQDPGGQGEEVEVPHCARESQAKELAALARKGLAEGPVLRGQCQDCPRAVEGDAAPELHNVSSAASIPGGLTARGEEVETPKRRASTSTPKAARNGDPVELQGDGTPQGLEEVLFQDPESKMTTARSRTRRRSSCQSRRVSLAEKYSLASKREGMIRRSISRAMSKKAAGRESSSASSRVSCQSSLEVFVEEDVTSSIRTRSYNQGMSVVWDGQQTGGRPLSPLDEKHKNSANQAPPSFPANKVVRPLKNFLQAVQRTQLLASPDSAGRVGVIKNFIKHSTPTRPDLKGDFVSKERQRLESLRKKQEAEEQRRRKVEEEKRRRQAEMKQKREERLRKALQARERVEQMEEEKKKRMEQKILQSDEKVWLSQAREERVAEERSKQKLSKKHGDAEGWKQKVPSMEEDEFEQHEPLQKRREDEVKEKGKRVLELKKLAEQRQVEQAKESRQIYLPTADGEGNEIKGRLLGFSRRLCKDGDVCPPGSLAESSSAQEEPEGRNKRFILAKLWGMATGWQHAALRCGSPDCGPPKGTEDSRSPMGNENNYGMDLNSDDSTDDENDPRKPVPAWADGTQLNQAIIHQYYHPINVDQLFGLIPSPKLEDIFGKSKPRYFKRTSSAVWHSPPGTKSTCGPSCNFKN